VVAIISLLIILVVSILVTRIATIALTHTGLSRQTAKFQARSAFTGVGFTTSESEKIVNHPVRRRILLILMLLGNAGIVSAVASLIIGLVRDGQDNMFLRVALLLSGVLLLWLLASSKWIDRRVSSGVSRLLSRHTNLSIRDYEAILHVSGDYKIHELAVEPGDWLAGNSLKDLRLRDEGVQVLGITRPDGTYLGVPGGDTTVQPNDSLLLYGRDNALKNLDERRHGRSGEQEHNESVRENRSRQRQEASQDRADAAGGGDAG
jgi:K+/H+ antiporter YhaU regulatory subunit KhtT